MEVPYAKNDRKDELGVVSSFDKWLSPLRMLGMAFLFTSITLALTVIIGVLRLQAGMLARFYQQASGRTEAATADPTVGDPGFVTAG